MVHANNNSGSRGKRVTTVRRTGRFIGKMAAMGVIIAGLVVVAVDVIKKKLATSNGNNYSSNEEKSNKSMKAKAQSRGIFVPIIQLKCEDDVLVSADVKGEITAEIVIPSGVRTIGDHAFSGCNVITDITIPNSVTDIGKYAFSRCNSLTGIVIPKSVTNIGEGAFTGCSALKSVTIIGAVECIEDGVFFDCSALESINIPDGVTSIKTAFSGCYALRSVTIPDSVTHFSASAFNNCSPELVIYARAGSHAEKHANIYSIKFEAN